jgi:parallel beta-helix repeat protein
MFYREALEMKPAEGSKLKGPRHTETRGKVPLRHLAVATLVAAVFLMSAATARAASSQTCESSIVSCGCTITSAGYYEVDAPLASSQGMTARSECVAIKASSVTLNLLGSQISGPGGPPTLTRTDSASATIGIHVLAGSNNNFIEGAGAIIGGWTIGLQLEGAQNTVEFFESNDNDVAGVLLDRANSNTISDFIANHNGEFGVWLQQSNNNQINCSDADNNATSGIYLGCSPSPPTGIGCRRGGASTGNHLFNLVINGNGVYGIMLDSGSKHTTIADVSAQQNLVADLDDENAACGSNFWFDNSFVSVSQSCVD